jgi:ESF2/ABP1 family protein
VWKVVRNWDFSNASRSRLLRSALASLTKSGDEGNDDNTMATARVGGGGGGAFQETSSSGDSGERMHEGFEGSGGHQDDDETDGCSSVTGEYVNSTAASETALDEPPPFLENTKKKKKVHRLSLTKTEDFNQKLKRRGVVYVARVPPRMTPTRIRALLEEHAVITRVYLAEEDPAVRKRRKKQLGGSGSKRYTEGWVEFEDKKLAKHVAANLNTTPITNRKRSPHHGDLWALKYLPKFQWSHLTEKVAYERRVREQKLRLETMQARRETAAYRELVETGKKLDKIEERRKRRRREEEEDDEAAPTSVDGDSRLREPQKKAKTRPIQIPLIDGDGSSGASKKPLLGALM